MLNCIRSLDTHSEKGADPVQFRKKYLGVSHLSGISVSVIIIIWLETDQPNYLYANTCHDVQESIRMQKSTKSRVWTDS